MSQHENGQGEDLPARRQAREDRDRIKAAFGARLRVLLDLSGLSSREFAARFPAYKDSTVRKYTLGTNLPPWDFLNDLLTEVARRTDDPAAPQRRTELFTAYRSVLIDTGATTRGSDQNSLLLRLLDGEEDLHRLAAELAEVRGRENRLRLDLEEEIGRAQSPGTGTASRERRHRLEEEARALAEHRGELVRRRGVLVTELDDSRRRLAVMEAAGSPGDLVPVGTGTGAGAHQAPPPLPPGPPTSFAEPSSPAGRGRRPLVLIAAAAAVVCLAGGGVVVGIWAAGNGDTGNRATPPVSATPRTTPTPSPATPSALATSAAPAPAPERSSRSLIEDLVPMDVYPEGTKRSFTAGALTVNNRDYPATLYAFEAERTWQLGREYKTFTASAGVSDATPSGDVITFTVQLDDGVAKEFTMAPGDTVKKVSLNISGVFRIKLTVQESFSTHEGYGAWIDPTITK
ncbi:NPCBM/NEW2 domain-containing protein [Streptomyces microflavus]|uniref:NPCBM/NEW2 domain-containing protein n=1 Tax=Streptomyces microflavus TaxID=1919 RepID=A0A7H8MEW1_STRMI|nr:NPCBM/NEW2 domain-containing protein [Streptomyces microflavus]QKW41067.1 NPCBM/NEW2 domain-containing protein [Streptomyces microflavus]